MKREYAFNKIAGDGYENIRFYVTKQLNLWLDSISNGEYVLSIERKARPRSISQNSLMWMWFTAIAKEWTDATGRGYTREMVKEYYCKLLIPVTLPNGDNIGGSTSELSTEQMTWFLDSIQADAATEFGITLPTPEDLRFEDWRKQYE